MKTIRGMGPLSLRATISPGTLDAENRTVDLTWTTGARVQRGGYGGKPYQEELSLDPNHVRMGRLNGGAPLLDSHNGSDLSGVIGVVKSARIDGNQGIATVRFARAEDDPAADAIFRKVQDGIIRNVSVGYRVHKMERAEGGESALPVYRAIDWEPYEISMVPMGADAGAGVRADGAENPCEFVDAEPTKGRAMDNDDEQAGGQATVTDTDKSKRSAADAPDLDGIRKLAVATERKRSADLRRIGAQLSGVGTAFIERHIGEGTTAAAFREAAVDEHARVIAAQGDANVAGISIEGTRVEGVRGGDSRDKWMRGAGDWLASKGAVDGMIVDEAKKRGETVKVDPGEFRGMSLVELARMALERGGVRTNGMDKRTVLGMALTQRGGGMNGTGDFPVLLETVVNKVLLAAYGTTPDTWSQFCTVGSVADFRPYNRYRMGNFGRLQALNEAGEFVNQSVPDGEKQTISASTKGNIIALTRQALINDDMGAFTRLASMIGRAARLSIEMDVYDLITSTGGLGPLMHDGNPLFDASHNNIGTPGALSIASLDADRVTMAIQKDPAGQEFLDLRPAILLIPVGLGGQARIYNNSQYDSDVSSKFQVPNKVVGLFQTVIDTPRLSGTRRYMLASPTIAPTLEVVFLEGQQTPFLEAQNGWRIDGVEWKVRLDYGVGAIDTRGALTNAGA